MIDIGDFLRVPICPGATCVLNALERGQPEDGLIAEFGVYTGTIINMIAKACPNHTIHGFDSFVGLPSEWVRGGEQPLYKPGHFDCGGKLPIVPPNATLHRGWFKDTIPPFLEWVQKNGGKPFRLLDIDCDLYVSTQQILTLCNEWIDPGTVIYFDELCDWGGGGTRYPEWEQHEYKALLEWCQEFGRSVKAISRNGAYGAAVVVEK